MKKELFPKVKEFINENDDVNGMIVAQEFGIERSIVHEWVVEGQKDIWSTRKSLIINQAF
ncbi:MAG: hypothetical protein IJJ59_02350 [Pseudobutyrivibrio sp.]|uniref:hypothetical protein n=1 Tax=Pseudobutyrivibrio sp. TaxID=2014367 RepID=UPI0025F0D159|nr:hypothetical protein [Pseudobutyrivibrio sp.]MBQ6462148.1 hypothetical protein [Pseudobutyrivibrio sp.]